MDWLSHGALPIGFLMFFGMALAFMKRRASHKLASRAFPKLAGRLGLAYKPSPYKAGIGTLSGRLAGYRVFVDPDDQRKISLHFESSPQIWLRNYDQNQRPPGKLSRLYSGNKAFDAYFKTRYAGNELSERIRQHKGWSPLIARASEAFRRELKQFNVSETGITLMLDFGNPPHIPGAVVEQLLELMLDFARVIDPLSETPELSAPPARAASLE